MCLHRPNSNYVTLGGLIYGSLLTYTFSTVSGLGRVSVRWSTGMTLPSFRKNTVRPVVSVSANIALDSHLGAASNLNHAVAGIYL